VNSVMKWSDSLTVICKDSVQTRTLESSAAQVRNVELLSIFNRIRLYCVTHGTVLFVRPCFVHGGYWSNLRTAEGCAGMWLSVPFFRGASLRQNVQEGFKFETVSSVWPFSSFGVLMHTGWRFPSVFLICRFPHFECLRNKLSGSYSSLRSP
jgi:hypothetical protein